MTVGLDELGPEGVKRCRGRQPVQQPAGEPAPRAIQAIDYGRRGKGYGFGAFQPATGAAFTACYGGRTMANRVDFLVQVEAWLPANAERVYAVLDHLSTHRARDGLRFSLAFSRWAFGFQPTYAAYVNLIEPWWKTLRSLALQGKRFETGGKLHRRSLRRRAIGTPTSIPPSGAEDRLNLADAPLRAYSYKIGSFQGDIGAREAE